MDDAIKNRVILILGILTAILFISNISSCSNAYRQKAARDKEMAQRMDLEEKMSKYTRESAKLEEKASVSIKELEEEKAAHQATKKALVQEQLVNQSLKEELQKVTKLKEALE
ncbi:MAG TPA: hypothetical protein VMD04_05235, partial [Candidatus Margulisiibacteriota bacterium]|nr:hypothetical protein [Candidatus Margulisiibacteriota bacterium]